MCTPIAPCIKVYSLQATEIRQNISQNVFCLGAYPIFVFSAAIKIKLYCPWQILNVIEYLNKLNDDGTSLPGPFPF